MRQSKPNARPTQGGTQVISQQQRSGPPSCPARSAARPALPRRPDARHRPWEQAAWLQRGGFSSGCRGVSDKRGGLGFCAPLFEAWRRPAGRGVFPPGRGARGQSRASRGGSSSSSRSMARSRSCPTSPYGASPSSPSTAPSRAWTSTSSSPSSPRAWRPTSTPRRAPSPLRLSSQRSPARGASSSISPSPPPSPHTFATPSSDPS
mmetsp:Transcript_14818/g.37104  ORF Transcript_14818/g.37104 Transcript_14818/m.37104 type:complete len:206 (+) Transcript_14818:183-800(+)